MKLVNERHVQNAPIEATPHSEWGAKLHMYKFDFYADPKGGDDLMMSWPKGDKDVAHCASEEEFIEVMRGLYARLSMEAHKRAAEAAKETE